MAPSLRDPIPHPPSRRHSFYNLHTTLSNATPTPAAPPVAAFPVVSDPEIDLDGACITSPNPIHNLNPALIPTVPTLPPRPALTGYIRLSSYRHTPYSPLCTIYEHEALQTPSPCTLDDEPPLHPMAALPMRPRLRALVRDTPIDIGEVAGVATRRRAAASDRDWPLPPERLDLVPDVGTGRSSSDEPTTPTLSPFFKASPELSSTGSPMFHSAVSSPLEDGVRECACPAEKGVGYPFPAASVGGKKGKGLDESKCEQEGECEEDEIPHPGKLFTPETGPMCPESADCSAERPCHRSARCVQWFAESLAVNLRSVEEVRELEARADRAREARRPGLWRAAARRTTGSTVELVRSGEVMTRVVVKERAGREDLVEEGIAGSVIGGGIVGAGFGGAAFGTDGRGGLKAKSGEKEREKEGEGKRRRGLKGWWASFSVKAAQGEGGKKGWKRRVMVVGSVEDGVEV